MSGRRAVTEADIRAAVPARTLAVPVDAVVTPAAGYLAKQLGIARVRRGTAGPGDGGTDRAAPDSALPIADSRRAVIALGADHGGFPLKEALKPLLAELGHDVLDVGTFSADPVDYPDFAVAVARAVQEGRAWRGIMVDGAGIGSAMAANKIRGVRAALCYDLTTAANAREHNDANVLTLGGGLIGTRLATDIVRAFLTTGFGGGRHAPRVDKINLLDSGRP